MEVQVLHSFAYLSNPLSGVAITHQQQQRPSYIPSKIPVCIQYQLGRSGTCKRGIGACRYAHLERPFIGGEVVICRDACWNRCPLGHSCRFYHPTKFMRMIWRLPDRCPPPPLIMYADGRRNTRAQLKVCSCGDVHEEQEAAAARKVACRVGRAAGLTALQQAGWGAHCSRPTMLTAADFRRSNSSGSCPACSPSSGAKPGCPDAPVSSLPVERDWPEKDPLESEFERLELELEALLKDADA